ncbi:MAG: TonB-dependent receptor [Acidobacteriota bacterium]|jgi:outer membrane receptor protein involved in Fe transport
MKPSLVQCVVVLGLAAALLVAAPAGAQEGKPAGQQGAREETITVTATRLPVRLSDLPVAARAWDAAELQSAPAIVIDEALRDSPAVSLFRRTSSRDSHPTTQGLNLRGIAPSGVSRALVLLDGVPMNDPFGGWVYWDRVPLLGIEQVEVALGGGSAPWGSQALGGVMQLVSRRTLDSSMQMQALAGNESTVRFGIAVGQGFSAGSVFASAQLFSTAGYIGTAPADRGTVDTPLATNNQAARVRLDVGGFTFNVDGLREARDNGTPLQVNDTQFGGLSGAWNMIRADGNGGGSAYALARTQKFNSTFTSVAPDRDSENLVLVQRVPSTDFGAGGYGWWSRDTLKLSFGGDWRRVDGISEEYVVFSGATRRPGGVQNAGGGFGGIDWQANQALSISAGLRFDGWEQTPAREVDAQPRSATALSPRAGVAWRSPGGLVVRGSAYGAFRAPTLNELYRQFRVGNVSTLANPDLEAERLWGAEGGGGWSGTLSDDVELEIDGTYYWNHLDDGIINATISVSPSLILRRRENLGSATARGVELNGRLSLRDAWTLALAYAWLDSFIREPVPGFDPQATLGKRLPQVPTYRANAAVSYRSGSGWGASATVAATGVQFEDDFNELPLAAAVTVGAALEVPLIDAARLTVRAENLFNEDVEVRRTPVLVYGAPRLVYAGVTLSWPD